jgi:3',5'-cyclic AMP phosphodiesterase CpdA
VGTERIPGALTLAHISDLHVKVPYTDVPWRRFASKRVVGGLNLLLHRSHPLEVLDAALDDLRRDPPDHLVVTGDLTNLSLDVEFAAALERLRSLDLPPERISVIPGNHDVYTRGAQRSRRCEQHLAPLLGLSPDELRWPRVQELPGGVRVVSTCSAWATTWFTAHGWLGEEQLQALGETLARKSESTSFTVVLVHHPPLLGHGRPDRWIRNNRDHARLLEVCRAGGVDLLLCGHTHRAFTWVVADPPALRIECAGSTTKAHGAAYNRYTIAAGALRGVEVRAYDPASGEFAPLRSPVGG